MHARNTFCASINVYVYVKQYKFGLNGLLYLISSLIPGLFFATQQIDGRTHEKYGLVSTAELIVVIVRMH